MKIDLQRIPIPGADEAEVRALAVVSLAFAEQPQRPAQRHRGRLILVGAVVAVTAALVAVAVSPAGSQIVHSVREAVGLKKAAPALTALPAPGRLLVSSTEGPWIVAPDGSKRLLGRYVEAAWSPHGLYVAVTRQTQLLAVDPHGTVRWLVTRTSKLSLPRWAPDGYRIAYLEGSSLRIVNGDGTGDRGFAGGVASVAPAWRPSTTHEHVLAFATTGGELELYDVDTNTRVARDRLPAAPRELLWSKDGTRLVVLSAHTISVFTRTGEPLGSIKLASNAVAAAFVPGSHRLAVILSGAQSNAASFDVDHRSAPPQEIFTGAGRFGSLAYSPDGHWLLLTWPTANQWLFIRSRNQRIAAVSAIASQFSPGSPRVAFPTLDGWCC
jgi:hypothetical protein